MPRLASIHFTGPRDRKWCLTPVDLDAPLLDFNFQLHHSIKSNSGIMSSDWTWRLDLHTLRGEIYAPPSRVVGTIEAKLIETEVAI